MTLRKRYLFVCTNRRPDGHPKGSCSEKGADEVRGALKKELGARGLAAREARACTSGCLDVCSQGVTVLVSPDQVFLGHVKVGDVAAIVDSLETGIFPEHLVLNRDDVERG